MRFFLYVLLLLLAISAGEARSNAIRLFSESGEPVKGFADLARGLKAGDTVIFSDDRRFELKEFLGKGGTTFIFEIEGGRALRIPKDPKYFGHIDKFIDGYSSLKQNGVDIIEMKSSRRGEYVVVEKIFKRFDFNQLYRQREDLGSQKEYKYAKSKFLDFAKTTHLFEKIGDFKADQVVWQGKKWILLDWTEESRLAKSGTSKKFGVYEGAMMTEMMVRVYSSEEIDKLDKELTKLRRSHFEGQVRHGKVSGAGSCAAMAKAVGL